ncbi:integrase core domain protein [Burkholderia pseudomallei]|nr:integrase core domain protein [Burkholderia pseudomallei]
MRQARLVRSKRVHRYRAAQAESLIAPNLLARRFDPAQRDQVWVGDITFVQTRQGWLYVAVVMDLYARRVVGWAFSQHADTDLALKALRRAYDHRRPPPGLMFHSDQGCQYTSTRFLAELRGPWHDPEHESARQLLGQRGGRALLPKPQKMNGSATSCTSITAMQSKTSLII